MAIFGGCGVRLLGLEASVEESLCALRMCVQHTFNGRKLATRRMRLMGQYQVGGRSDASRSTDGQVQAVLIGLVSKFQE